MKFQPSKKLICEEYPELSVFEVVRDNDTMFKYVCYMFDPTSPITHLPIPERKRRAAIEVGLELSVDIISGRDKRLQACTEIFYKLFGDFRSEILNSMEEGFHILLEKGRTKPKVEDPDKERAAYKCIEECLLGAHGIYEKMRELRRSVKSEYEEEQENSNNYAEKRAKKY